MRVQRGAMRAEDSLWLEGTAGAVLIAWPRDSSTAFSADGVLATLGGSAALVAPLARRDVAPAPRVIARWRDGAPAATERALGQGCLRDIGIGLPERGDLTLRTPFVQLLRVLVEPCGGQRSAAPADSVLAAFAGTGALAPAAAFDGTQASSSLTPWLLLLALALLVFEHWWRRR